MFAGIVKCLSAILGHASDPLDHKGRIRGVPSFHGSEFVLKIMKLLLKAQQHGKVIGACLEFIKTVTDIGDDKKHPLKLFKEYTEMSNLASALLRVQRNLMRQKPSKVTADDREALVRAINIMRFYSVESGREGTPPAYKTRASKIAKTLNEPKDAIRGNCILLLFIIEL